MSRILENWETIQRTIREAAAKTGRQASDITVAAVTKSAGPDKILEAYGAGVRIFAENRVQDAAEKIPQTGREDLSWHFIGHLQSNKVKSAVSLFSMIQSVDTLRIAQKIGEEAALQNKVMPVLLQVNISGEAQKYGFRPEEVYGAVEAIAELPNVRVLGVMGIGPLGAEESATRACFKTLRNLFIVLRGLKRGNLEIRYLSMGMSEDYRIAIEEGANFIRLGRALFK